MRAFLRLPQHDAKGVGSEIGDEEGEIGVDNMTNIIFFIDLSNYIDAASASTSRNGSPPTVRNNSEPQDDRGRRRK